MYKMEFRNVKKINDNELVMEIKHPEYGWLPYTAVKNSGEEQMEEIFKAATKKAKEYDLTILRNRVESNLVFKLDDKIKRINSNYDKAEVDSFNVKRIEAEKVLAGETSELLEMEASLGGENVTELATKIIEKNNTLNLELVKIRTIKANLKKELDEIYSHKNIIDIEEKYTKLVEE